MRTSLFRLGALLVPLAVTSGATAADAPFCVVSAAGAQCIYTDAVVCRQAAAALRGACVARVPAQGSGDGTLKPLFAPGDFLNLQRETQDDADRQLARQLVPLVYGATARTQSELIVTVGGPGNFAALMRTTEGRAAVEWWERHHEQPTPQTPSLTFTSQLDGVEVWLDDKRVGELGRHQWLILTDVAVGNHTVRAKKTGYMEWSDTVEVTANEHSVIDVDRLGRGPVRISSPNAAAPEATETPASVRRLVPLSPEIAARVRTLLACRQEVTEAENTEARRQQIGECMERHGYPQRN